MGKRCDCAVVCKDNPDKTFEELIKMGIICDICARNYYEFCQLIENEPDNQRRTIKEFDAAWQEFFKDKPRPRSDEEDRKQQEAFHKWYNDGRKHSDTGKTPREMGKRIMEFHWDDSEECDYFITLNELLVPETKDVKKLKAISGSKVEEYAEILGPIEHGIAEYFLENQHITDLDVKKALKSFIKEPFKEFDYVKCPIGYEIQFGASIGAQQKKISLHELRLTINFIILSIENRNYLMDERAYLKWICAFLGYLNKGDVKKIEEDYALWGSLNNVPQKEVEELTQTLYPEKALKKLS